MFLGKSPLLRREFDGNSHLKDGTIKVLVIGESHANHLAAWSPAESGMVTTP